LHEATDALKRGPRIFRRRRSKVGGMILSHYPSPGASRTVSRPDSQDTRDLCPPLPDLSRWERRTRKRQ